jgi:hypothetical protein
MYGTVTASAVTAPCELPVVLGIAPQMYEYTGPFQGEGTYEALKKFIQEDWRSLVRTYRDVFGPLLEAH